MSTTAPGSIMPQPLNVSSKSSSPDPPPSDQTWQRADEVMLDTGASRILIVDDDLDILKLVERMAACLGYAPESAENAMDALILLNQTHYDLVLTDYYMPVVDGQQLADQIKRRCADTKVIIMTGYCEEAIINMLNASDAVDGLLLKPFNLATLKEKFETVDRPHVGHLAF